MMYRPSLLRTPQQGIYNVVELRAEHPLQRLKFWGMVLIGIAVLSVFLFPQFRGTEPSEMLVPALTGAVGSVMWVAAGKAKENVIELATIDQHEKTLKIHDTASTEIESVGREVWFDEVEDVLFGMTLFPMEPGADMKIEAFSVCVQLYDGSVLPIVEASPDKAAAFGIAKSLSALVGAPIRQTGLGYENDSSFQSVGFTS